MSQHNTWSQNTLGVGLQVRTLVANFSPHSTYDLEPFLSTPLMHCPYGTEPFLSPFLPSLTRQYLLSTLFYFPILVAIIQPYLKF
jgi:hypothetical protein